MYSCSQKSSRQQTESESDKKPYIWFSMGIDHIVIPYGSSV